MVSEATRHVMQANKSKNTKPELKVRAALRAAGLPGYRLHWKAAPGKPDICYPGRKVAIFVNGCFWHRCPYCALSTPKTNVEFWTAKFERNRARDRHRICFADLPALLHLCQHGAARLYRGLCQHREGQAGHPPIRAQRA